MNVERSTVVGGEDPGAWRAPVSRPRLAVLVVLNLALAGVGLWLVTTIGASSAAPQGPGPAPVHSFTAAAPGRESARVPSLGDTVEATTVGGLPTTPSRRGCSSSLVSNRLVIPALCVDAPVVSTTRTADGALTIPHDVRTIGRWDDSARLADPPRVARVGTTLLAGHVNMPGQGSGALYRLGSLRPHDLVYTTDANGVVSRWRVVSLTEVHKDQLPGDVFAGRTGPRRLVLVTCGGPVIHLPGHGASYRDNVIATAVPA